MGAVGSSRRRAAVAEADEAVAGGASVEVVAERVAVTEFVEELEIAASIEATQRELQFGVERLNQELFVEVDRQLFASAISNLLQNAFKFTRPLSHVLSLI